MSVEQSFNRMLVRLSSKQTVINIKDIHFYMIQRSQPYLQAYGDRLKSLENRTIYLMPIIFGISLILNVVIQRAIKRNYARIGVVIPLLFDVVWHSGCLWTYIYAVQRPLFDDPFFGQLKSKMITERYEPYMKQMRSYYEDYGINVCEQVKDYNLDQYQFDRLMRDIQQITERVKAESPNP